MTPLLAVLIGVVVLMCAAAYGLGMLLGMGGLHRRPPPEEPTGRPIEAIAVDLRRLGARFHGLDPHTSYAKVEAVRSAYDRTLAECCTALGLTHLLGVLPAGPELDAERERVEVQLAGRGVRLPHAA